MRYRVLTEISVMVETCLYELVSKRSIACSSCSRLYFGAIPDWDFDVLDEIYIDGIESSDFRFYRDKANCIE